MSKILTLMALILVLAAAPVWAQPQWEQMQSFSYPAREGSALCAGDATEPGGAKQCVWLLHGQSNRFERYDVAEDEWEYMKDLPDGQTGPGGALAYVPDPFAYPSPSGWVFALKGGNTADFLMYSPGCDAWTPLEPAPQNVIAGGALCYGGEEEVGGLRCAILYAFTGQTDQDRGGFYRYVFPLVPTYRPEGQHWQELEAVPDGVSPGAALAWTPINIVGWPVWIVNAFVGNSTPLYWYVKLQGSQPFWWLNDYTTWSQNNGACMTGFTDHIGEPVVAMLYGSGHAQPVGDSWCDFYYPTQQWPRFIRQANTPLPVGAGSALAYVAGGMRPSAVYAEFGEQEEENYTFWRLPVSATYGEQSRGNVPTRATRVQVLPGRNQTRFVVTGWSGPVSLKILTSAGAVVATLRADATGGRAELVWQHTGVPSGVYLYSVPGTTDVVTGKVMVVK